MSKIKVMDNILANKIAAGEVIERTMNVVKELVENSLDASSTEISIKLVDSGVKEIEVSDNGIGMDREDAENAFLRHATSKLETLEDLFNIETLGFRGEALPSIASVSHVVLKTADNEIGTRIELDGGRIEKIENSNLTKGTIIRVSNLFYNTPVRLKYLKNYYVELANITDYVNKMALANPSVKFTLINNGKTLLQTSGDGNLLKVIYSVFGSDVAKKMIEVNDSNDDYTITGYISYPEVARSTRNSMITFVNGRLIRNNTLNRKIIEAYHTYIPKDKAPIVVINIETDPILIDINIHPTKMDIKFSKDKELYELIEKAITSKLEKLLLIPTISVRDEVTVNEVDNNIPKKEEDIPVFSDIKSSAYLENTNKVDTPSYQEISINFDVEEERVSYEEVPKEEDESRIKKMYPKGIVHATYIIAENEDGMYIIDQHAAAERINYEKYLYSMSQDTNTTIEPLRPIKIELPANEFIMVKKNIDLLDTIGITAEEFGQNTFIVRSHPTWLKEGYEKESLKKIFELIATKEEFSKEKFVEKTAITLACRMSIKANDYISTEDMQYLLDTLRACKNPFTCPHGRPTIITYTIYDLEKLFKRAMD